MAKQMLLSQFRCCFRSIVLFLGIFLTGLYAGEFPQFGDLEPGNYAVGFQIISTYDYSRTFDTPKYTYKGEFQEGERARPVNIALWYPAQKTTKAVYRPYEAYFYPPVSGEQELTDQQKAAAREAVKNSPLAGNVDETSFMALMSMNTAVVEKAVAAEGAFPLIVIAQGFSQLPTTLTILSEYLASHGYIVASCRSAGQHGGMTLNLVGAEAQARDMEFIIGYLHDYPNLDRDRLGLIGFSFGGLASSLVMMRNTDVEAVVSLDSAIGTAQGFALLFQSPYYNAASIRAPIMHLMTENSPNINLNFFNAINYANLYIIKFQNIRHQDFTSWGILSSMVPNFARFAGEIPEGVDLGAAHAAIGRYTRHFLDAYVKKDQQALAFLGNGPEDNGISSGLISAIEVQEPQDLPPAESDITSLVLSSQIEEVVNLYRKFKESDPDLVLFQENPMNNLGYQLLGQQRVEEAIEVFKLNIEAYPDSWNVYDSLGEAYGIQGDTENAIKYYSIALEMNPDDQQIIDILNNLKKSAN